MTFAVRPIGPIAAEVEGVNCADPFEPHVKAAVKQAFQTHPVLVFRNQVLGAREFGVFARMFGTPEGYGNPFSADARAEGFRTAAHAERGVRATPDQMLYLSPEDPDVLVMTNEVRPGLPTVGIVDNAEMWHSDGAHRLEPCRAIAVHVLHNPPTGGETEFCDLRALYDALSHDTRTALAGLVGVHHWSKAKNPRFAQTLARDSGAETAADRIPETPHPLVRRDPDTGRSSLYLSPRFTLRIHGIEAHLSDMLLTTMFGLMDEPRFHYHHRWHDGDLMIWDNRCLNHRVLPYRAEDIRCRHRISIAGEQPLFLH